MDWTDGSTYKGLWIDGVQSGIGLMIFPNNVRKVGFFVNNVFKKNLETMKEFDQEIQNHPQAEVPPEFREEIEEWLLERRIPEESLHNHSPLMLD